MNNLDISRAQDLIKFWQESGPGKWFAKDAAFDALFRERFFDWHIIAAKQELEHWLSQPESALALILLLDQYPRNAFRGTAHMFATDGLALSYARRALDYLEQTETELRNFICLPFMHSESIEAQKEAVSLYKKYLPDSVYWAQVHYDIIAQFGRFPHRNAALGRITTPAEQEYLDNGGFAG